MFGSRQSGGFLKSSPAYAGEVARPQAGTEGAAREVMITTILAHLEAFTPADATEADHHRRMLRLARADADPTLRTHFDPGHFTASAFVLSPHGELLLVFHRRLERWLQPGGHIDPSDGDPIAAARREVAEETGLAGLAQAGAGLFDVDVHPIPSRPGEPAHAHHDLRYLFRASSTALTPADDVADAAWVPLAEVPVRTNDASVLRAIGKLPAPS